MLNLDNMDIAELESLVKRIEEDKHQAALELFPSKEPGFVKSALALGKYAKARLDMIDDLEKGREHKRKNHEILLSKLYRAIPEYAQW